eukprot:12428638-Karenia_brevis.AAC.2
MEEQDAGDSSFLFGCKGQQSARQSHQRKRCVKGHARRRSPACYLMLQQRCHFIFHGRYFNQTRSCKAWVHQTQPHAGDAHFIFRF